MASVARYLARGGDGTRRREIVTPEGIPIQFTLASIGERATALALDMAIIVGVVFGVVFVATLASPGPDGSWPFALALLLVTLLRHFYFAFGELRGHGATLGKRATGIRVIDARGGSLEASAVLARNLVRELELWMPMTYVIGADMVWPDAPGWMWVVAFGWMILVFLLPLFNKDNLRIGDMIGGTLVVVQPKEQLRMELVVQRSTYAFTEAQLEVYGIYELQVLEGLLRGETQGDANAMVAVADKIRAKIKYADKVPYVDTERFLRDFYAALRAHLEKRLLFGKRREDKFDRR